MKGGGGIAAPKNTVEVISVLKKEYCTECGGACIECPLLGPLKLLEEWEERYEAQTEISVSLSLPDQFLGSRSSP